MRALTAAFAGKAYAHAAIGLHVAPMRAQAIVAHINVVGHFANQMVVKLPRSISAMGFRQSDDAFSRVFGSTNACRTSHIGLHSAVRNAEQRRSYAPQRPRSATRRAWMYVAFHYRALMAIYSYFRIIFILGQGRLFSRVRPIASRTRPIASRVRLDRSSQARLYARLIALFMRDA